MFDAFCCFYICWRILLLKAAAIYCKKKRLTTLISKDCELISSDGFIVAGANAQQHLSTADPLLFNYLIRKSVIQKTVRRDNQAQCSPSQFYLFSPSAAPTKLNLLSIFLLRLTKLLTTAFWYAISQHTF
ncbi:unnamed protein product [Gongylonema pulchrum]|uniref:Secreted protein n=1 Tax=Gongylonema pulchrum TaxID=637853 RepID=A0A183DCY3_9BILA|nr:unnamed protein product [Gongylonema pulchrum]